MKKEQVKKGFALLLSAVMVLSVSGCGNTGTADATAATTTDTVATASATETSSTGESVVYRSAVTEELNSLDPSFNQYATSLAMISNTNEGLYKYDRDGQITFGMAESVDISDDECTYTFHIRDAYWSNGDPVTANDWEYSWKRLADPANACPQSFFLVTAGIKNAYAVCYEGGDIDTLGVKAIDDKTLVVELSAPRSYLTYLLCNTTCLMPINQKFCEEMGDQFMLDKEHAISCGAYVMSEWEVGGTKYILDKNPTYYDADNVTCERLEYTLLTDTQQTILAYENGDLDIVKLSGDYIQMYANNPDLITTGYPGLFFIAFNTQSEYLSNQNLRLAISTAINKEPIISNILCDGSFTADYAIPSDFAATSGGKSFRDAIGAPTYNCYDLTAAASYWEKAKEELGTDNITLEFLYNEDSTLASVAAYIQSELQTNLPSLTVELRCTSYNQRLQDMSSGNYDFGLTRWYADYQDPLTYLDMWIASSSLNYEKWTNPEYEDLYVKVTGEYATDEEARLDAYKRMEKIVLDEAVICPLYQPVNQYLRTQKYDYVITPVGGTVTRYTDWAK